MSKPTRRKCPGCGKEKEFRADNLTCSKACSTIYARQQATQGPTLKEVNEISGDKWTIVLPKTRIHTLEQLLEFCKVDLDTWEVERFVANKWEMICNNDAAIDGVSPLYQIKAFLRRKRFATLDEYAKDNAKLRSRLEKALVSLRSERDIATRLAQNHAGYDDLLANIKEVTALFGGFSLPVERIAPNSTLIAPAVREGHSEDAVFLLSDTHFSAVHRREDTSGFPEFDLPIAGNRFGYVIRKAKQVLGLHRAMYPIKKLYVWLGGDIGNGILHDSPNSNSLFLPAQVHFSSKMLQFAIDDLLTLTEPDPETGIQIVEEIVLLFTVGNHMRLDEKMPYGYQAQRTLDWLIYQIVMDHFRGRARVTIREEMSPYIFEEIRGHRYMFTHGMQVGYKNSPDAQAKAMSSFIALVRALFDSPEYRKRVGLEGATFDRICIGDIHVPVSFPRLKSNGSLPGQNELGVNWTLEPIPAGQQLFGVSEKHIETWAYFLDCSHIQRDQKDFNQYGIFAAEYAKRIGRNS